MLQFKKWVARWEHTQTQTDARTKYVRGATQTDARDHFWASEMRLAKMPLDFQPKDGLCSQNNVFNKDLTRHNQLRPNIGYSELHKCCRYHFHTTIAKSGTPSKPSEVKSW